MSEQHEANAPQVSGEFDRMDMARAISGRTGLTVEQAKLAIDGFAKVLPDALVVNGLRIDIYGLGVFRVELQAPRKGVDPQGNPFETGQRQKVVFEAAPAVNSVLANATGIVTYSP